jgi:hypothetical protein
MAMLCLTGTMPDGGGMNKGEMEIDREKER